MPERKYKSVRKVDSSEVQGDGSWVTLKAPQVEHIKDAWGNQEADEIDGSLEILKSLVVDWNWVDDAGEPLPNPGAHPEVLDALPVQELLFLIGELGLSEISNPKN